MSEILPFFLTKTEKQEREYVMNNIRLKLSPPAFDFLYQLPYSWRELSILAKVNYSSLFRLTKGLRLDMKNLRILGKYLKRKGYKGNLYEGQ
jgi:hypothetical protein